MAKGKSRTSPPGAKKKRGVRLNRPDDVRRLLGRLINQTMENEIETDKLRAISYACQTIFEGF